MFHLHRAVVVSRQTTNVAEECRCGMRRSRRTMTRGHSPIRRGWPPIDAGWQRPSIETLERENGMAPWPKPPEAFVRPKPPPGPGGGSR